MSKRKTASRRDIAIVGMSGRFPGAPNLTEFWHNLANGTESISFFTPEELLAAGVEPWMLESPNYVRAGSILEDIDKFDASFFGVNAREAESMDPQERLFLECAWHALEDAGYDPEKFPGLIGVYAGCAMSSYQYEVYRNQQFVNLVGYLQVLIGNDKDYLTTHTSYKLNLRGPSLSIQTTCSTSLVATCVACEALLNHECDMALAGGVCVRVPQKSGYFYEPGGIFSPDGHCRVFDAKGQGVVFGNGVGIVVLKPLADALRDGDSIHAVIKGTAVNNDGSAKASYTAPGQDGQAAVIKLAQARAHVNPGTIGYVEAHGTGTTIGDPIEIVALTKAFRQGTKKKNFCAVGSVKSNFGHLDHAAGIAGLIKTALALEHKAVPPSLHFETPNPEIVFAGSPFFVNHTLREWKAGRWPRRAGVSAFGIGGTNAHVVLEEAPAVKSQTSLWPHHLLLLSARSRSALETTTFKLTDHLEQNPNLNPADLSYTYQVGRRAFSNRRAIVYKSIPDLMKCLNTLDSAHVLTSTVTNEKTPLIFMFSGQGAQYPDMGRDLYETEPKFREQVDYCCEFLRPSLGFDLRTVLYPAAPRRDEAANQLRQTAVTQPALFVIEYSLAKLWMHWGAVPQAMIGHSIGEYVAACLASVFSLQDALLLVTERGRLMQSLPPGAMVAVPLPESDLAPLLDEKVSLAALNEHSSCVVSGTMDGIARLEEQLKGRGVDCHRLHTSHAFHSAMMDPILQPFTEKVRKLNLKPPQLPWVSNVTGDWITRSQAMDPKYWANHLRQPVRFAAGLGVILKKSGQVLLEVGPGQTLSTFARRHKERAPQQVVLSSLRHPQEQKPDTEFALTTLGSLWLSGVPLNFANFHAHERRRRLHLPTYPFERQRYWVDPVEETGNKDLATSKNPDLEQWFYAPSWQYTVPPKFAEREAEASKASWLVFEDLCGLSAHMIRKLAATGLNITTVKPSRKFAELAAHKYEINPGNPADYDALFEKLCQAGNCPSKIVHFWAFTAPFQPYAGMRMFDAHQSRGFYSLISIAQALIKQNVHERVEIGLVTNQIHGVTGDETLCPGKATLLGACRAIPQEYPNLQCRNIDIVFPGLDGRRLRELGEQLWAEFSSSSLDSTVVYRGAQRWIQIFDPCPLKAPPAVIPLLREGGVYLITGGMGNMGLVLAKELAATVQATLILLGRSSFPSKARWADWLLSHGEDDSTSRKIRKLQEIEGLGSQVLVFSADLADEDELTAVLDQVYARFGVLDGVIHGAGSLDAGSFFAIDQATRELCERQFRPKVRGLMVLDKLLRGAQLDFWLLLSSVSSVLAGLGYVAYAAANIFLDSFATMKSQTTGVPWISINWDTWDYREQGEEAETQGLSMWAGEGLEALRRILSWAPGPQMVVSTGDLRARIDQWAKLKPVEEKKEAEDIVSDPRHARPDLAKPFMAPSNDRERAIAAIWRDALGISRVGVHDNFFTDLSGSSLLATQLVARLRSKFQIEFPLRRFFDGPTVAELALAIEEIEKSKNGALVPPPPAPPQKVAGDASAAQGAA